MKYHRAASHAFGIKNRHTAISPPVCIGRHHHRARSSWELGACAALARPTFLACNTTRISVLLFSLDELVNQPFGRKLNPVSAFVTFDSASPPNKIISLSATETSVLTSRLISVGLLLTPVSVFAKLESCCLITRSMFSVRICGFTSRITPLERYSIDCIGLLSA